MVIETATDVNCNG